MANGSAADKARKARNKADDAKYYGGDSRSLANKIAKTATGKSLTMDEQSRAGKIIQNRRMLDTGKTAARASFIERRTAKNAATERMNAAVGGGAPKKQAPKPAATNKKVPANPKATMPKENRANMSKPTAKNPAPKAPTKTTPMPKKTTKMTPEDAAMKKLLEKKYGKIYG
jgi:hypothetical protein